MRNRQWMVALLAVLFVVAAACGDDDDDAIDTTASTGSEPSGEAVELTLGAPPDCETNAFCLPGLARVYGLDLSGSFQPLEAGPVLVEALRAGEVDVANLFSTSPVIADEGWVLLEDDQQMLAADNVVPVLTEDLEAAYGTALTSVLDAISEQMDTAALTALNAAVDIDRADPADAAADWLAGAALPEPPASVPDGPEIVIGAQDFTESVVLAQVYAQALAAAGFDTSVQDLGGFRDLVLAAFDGGTINLTAEYAASMLEFLNEGAGEATGDAQATTDLLQVRLTERGLVALTPSGAVDTNAFVVTGATAQEYGLATLSDLAAVVNGS